MRWIAGITTAPRETNFLPATFTSFLSAGWKEQELTIFAEPESPVGRFISGNVRIIENARKLGPYENLRSAVKTLLQIAPSVDAYLLLQDDIEITTHLRRWLENDAIFHQLLRGPKMGVISLYTAAPNHSNQAAAKYREGRSGWHRIERVEKHAYGALAYVFPAGAARSFVASSVGAGKARAADYWVGRWCLESDRQYWCHSPSFIRHIGIVSSLGEHGGLAENRNCKDWIIGFK